MKKDNKKFEDSSCHINSSQFLSENFGKLTNQHEMTVLTGQTAE
jgi:hypothetical protein